MLIVDLKLNLDVLCPLCPIPNDHTGELLAESEMSSENIAFWV